MLRTKSVKEIADTIICTTVGGQTQYVFNAAIDGRNRRKATLTEDPAKARLYYEDDAKDLIPKLFPVRSYWTETFAPATIKKQKV